MIAITDFLNNYSLLKCTITNDEVELFFYGFIIHVVCLFLYGLISTWMNSKCSLLYTFLNLIYCVLHESFVIFFDIGLIFLFGDIGFAVFNMWIILFLICGFFKCILDDNAYLLELGCIPNVISENYENKHKYYSELNNDYNIFKQYNEDII